MRLHLLIDRLAHFPSALEHVVSMVGDDEARFKPKVSADGKPAETAGPGGHWSILEICCHLRDEEAEDFRPRIESTLRDPAAPWPLLDLDNIATRRAYNRENLDNVIEAFKSSRAVNVAWLRSLPPMTSMDWDHAFTHPKWGPIKAGELMTAWAAHDALHLRQIAKRLYELAQVDGGYRAVYAGEWGA